jgi:hypothetical protein
MNEFLSVRNFAAHQHYKDRSPPWIKLHAKVLTDYEFSCLPDASKAHLMLIWVLASKLDNRIPNDAAWIGRQIGATSPVDIQVLVNHGFLILGQGDSGRISKRLQDAIPEGETETEAVPSTHPAIDQFMESLPEGQNEQRWRAIVEDWQGGLGVEGGKPATAEDVAVGLSEYMLQDDRDFSAVHVRSYVERARRNRLKAAERGTGVFPGNGSRPSVAEQGYANAKLAIQDL